MHRTGRLLIVALSLCVFIRGTSAQGTHKPIVPLAPNDLFGFLPKAPAEWTMTESTAKNFFIGWVCAQATREFQHPAPASAQPGSPPLPPYITRVRLMDTGYFPSFNGDFENFRVGKYSNAESLVTVGMPSRRITISPTRERLRISVRGRFIVEIETDNQPPDSGKTWLQLLDFRKIAATPDSGATTLPKPIPIQTIDELHPTNNSSSQIHWGGPAGGTEP